MLFGKPCQLIGCMRSEFIISGPREQGVPPKACKCLRLEFRNKFAPEGRLKGASACNGNPIFGISPYVCVASYAEHLTNLMREPRRVVKTDFVTRIVVYLGLNQIALSGVELVIGHR
jgi:hypothetical protein